MTREVITRDIVGYEGLYTIDIFGNVINLKNNREVKQQKNKFGYMCVSLYKDKKQKQYRVHRLIAETFISNPQNKEQEKLERCLIHLEVVREQLMVMQEIYQDVFIQEELKHIKVILLKRWNK